MTSGTTPERDGTAPTLLEFLIERINEDEAAARESDADSWRGHVHDIDVRGWFKPDRVLAEVVAKRRIVDQARDIDCIIDGEWGASRKSDKVWDQDFTFQQGDGRAQGWDILKLLALPYADHPEYRAEWAPGSF